MPCQIYFMPFFAATWLEQNLRAEWQNSPTLQERRVVMHYVTTLPQRKGPEEQNAIGFAAAVGEPKGWRGVGFSWDEMWRLVCSFCSTPANCKFDWRLFWARLDGLFGLETFWKSLQPTLGRYEWCMARIFIGRQAASAKSRFVIIYTYTFKPSRKISAIKTTTSVLSWIFVAFVSPCIHFFPSHNPPSRRVLARKPSVGAQLCAWLLCIQQKRERRSRLRFLSLGNWWVDSRKKQRHHRITFSFFWLLVIFSLRFSELNFPEYAICCRICVWRIPRWNRCISWALRPTYSASMRR